MIFRKIHQKINTKKVLDEEYMLSLFRKRKEKFLARGEKLTDLNVELVRNFRGKFRNMSLRYELLTSYGSRIVRAKIHKFQDTPEIEWKILNELKRKKISHIPCPLDYFRPLNIYFYKEIEGTSGEEKLFQHKVEEIKELTPEIAKWLKKFHTLPIKKGILPIKNIKEEIKERRHWYFLVRKCAPGFYKDFSRLLNKLWQIRKRFTSYKSMVHGDFHWGNIIKDKNKFRVIDFGYAFYGDPLEDVGGFLAQNDSMFRYYAPEFLSQAKIIGELFLKNYFTSLESPYDNSYHGPRHLKHRQAPFLTRFTKEESKDEKIKLRLIYFEIRKILEMAAILALVEPNEDNKTRGITTLLKEAEEKLKMQNAKGKTTEKK